MGAHDEGVEQKLKAITGGANNLLATTRMRIAQALDSLDAGDFVGAGQQLRDAGNMVAPLAHAEATIGAVDDARLVRASELEEGMHVMELGEVTFVSMEDCAAARCPGHVKVKFGDEHEAEFGGNIEVFVANHPSEDDDADVGDVA